MAGKNVIQVAFLGDTSDLKKGFDDAEGSSNKLGAGLGKLIGVAAGIGAVTEGFEFLKGAIKDAAAEQENMAVLNHILDDTVHATDAQKEANEKWITSMQDATGISRDELEPALGKLLIAGRSVTQSHADMAVAADIAAARHIDLGTVVQAMGKAAEGSAGALGKLGIVTKDASGNTLDYDTILKNAEKTMGGSAAAAADTLAGRQKILGEKFKDLKVTIGTELMPVMETLTAALGTVATWVGDNLPIAIAAAQAYLAPLIASFQDWLVKMQPIREFIEAHLQPILIALGAALVLFVSPIGAVIAALVLAYTHFQTFRNVVDTVVQFLVDSVLPVVEHFASFLVEQFQHVVSWVQENWPAIQEAITHVMNVIQDVITTVTSIISAIWSAWGDSIISIAEAAWQLIQTTIQVAVRLVQDIIKIALDLINGDWGKAWDAIKDLLSAVWTEIGAVVQFAITFVKGIIEGVLNDIKALWNAAWEAIKSALSDAWEAIKNAISTAIGDVIDFFEKLPGRVINALGDIASTLYDSGKKLIGGLINAIHDAEWDLIDLVGSLPDKIIEALGDIGHLLYDIGKKIIGGLIDGIRDMLGSLGDVLGGIGSFITDHKGPPSYDAVLLRPAGRMIIGGLVDGFEDQVPAVQSSLGKLTNDTIPSAVRPSGGGGGGNIYVTVNAGVGTDPAQLERVLVDALTRYTRTNGTSWQGVAA